MSLISDALRRARQEGEGARQGGPRLPGPLGPPPRRGRPAVWAVIPAAVLAAALGAGAVWLVVHPKGRAHNPGTAPAAAVVVTSGATPVVTPRPPAAPGGKPGARRGSLAPGAPGAPGAAASPGRAGTMERPATPPPPVRSPLAEARSVPAAPPAPAAVAPARLPVPALPVSDEARRVAFGGRSVQRPKPGYTDRGAPWRGPNGEEKPGSGGKEVATGRSGTVRRKAGFEAGSRPENGNEPGTGPPGTSGGSKASTGPRELVGEGTVDGVRLALDYLVYRSRDPFAQINGVEVHVGSQVDGFKVVAVTEEGVRLMGAGGPVLLRVR